MEEMDKQYCYKYPHPAVTTDCVILTKETPAKVLLIKRGNEPYKGCWAFPGGFLNPDETAEEGALRELQEETNLREVELRQFHTFTDPHRDPRERVISIVFIGFLDEGVSVIEAGDDASDAKWFPLTQLPPLAFDHDKILQTALKTLNLTDSILI